MDLGYPYFRNPHLCEEQWWKVKVPWRIPGKMWPFFSMNKKNTSTMRWAVLHVRVLTIFFGITFQVGRFGWNTCWPQQCGAGFVVSFFLQTSLLAPVCCNLLQTQGCHEQCETTTLRSPSSVKPKTIMQIQSQRSTLWNATLPSTQNRVHKIHVLQIWNTSINLGQNQRHYCDVTPMDTNRNLQKKMNQGLQSIQFRFNLYYKSNPQCHPKHEI